MDATSIPENCKQPGTTTTTAASVTASIPLHALLSFFNFFMLVFFQAFVIPFGALSYI
jgi:hypothetical protein